MIRSYTTLNDPIAQISAADEFCASVHAYVEDMYVDVHGGKPPDVEEVHVNNVLDSLARLGLRFELDGAEQGEGYFLMRSHNSALDRCLQGYAVLVAEDFEENEFIVLKKKKPTVVDLITVHSCGNDNLIFVPDHSGVSSAAYMLSLTPGRVLNLEVDA